MRKKRKKKLSVIISDWWLDLKVKLIILGAIFISFMIVVMLVVLDFDQDKKLLETKADKYETYVDQLLLSKYDESELKEMSSDRLRQAIDLVIEEEHNRVISLPKLNDFILPIKEDDYTTRFKITREPKTRWEQGDIDQYWIDLNTLEIEKLDENNFEYLKARLKDIR